MAGPLRRLQPGADIRNSRFFTETRADRATFLAKARSSCTSVVIGEGEPVWKQILADAETKTLKRRYRADRPYDLTGAGTPDIGLYIDTENEQYRPDDYPLQLCRGCPVRCVACAIPAVMGTQFRFFDHETNIQAALELYRRGKRMCITEDTLFLPKNRRIFKNFLLDLYERTDHQPIRISYIGISMPMILNLDAELLKLLVKIGRVVLSNAISFSDSSSWRAPFGGFNLGRISETHDFSPKPVPIGRLFWRKPKKTPDMSVLLSQESSNLI